MTIEGATMMHGQRWEYLIARCQESFSGDEVAVTTWLNGFGGQGWELVVFTGTYFYFKRPLQPLMLTLNLP